MEKFQSRSERMDRLHAPTLRNWEKPSKPGFTQYNANTYVKMGWGRIIFGHTFDSNEALYETMIVAETVDDKQILGTVTGVDHVEAFSDPENGASLWCLAVDPKAVAPGVGELLLRHLVEHYFTRGRNYVDLSVMHDNQEAIRLYQKVGFQRVPAFCVKYKNSINEQLYTAPQPEGELNPYAMIIINEARRRGIGVEILDDQLPLFSLNMGGRNILCRESLTDLTTSVAMMRCDDKRLTHQALRQAGLHVPGQFKAGDSTRNADLLADLKRVVVKPARAEQGMGISVDIDSLAELQNAVARARKVCPDVLI